MAEKRLLVAFNDASDGFAMLCPDSGPALIGKGNVDWYCYECDSLLLEKIYERQTLNLLVRCYTCGRISATPEREAGEPLIGRTMLFPPGRYRLSSHVDTSNKQVTLAGNQAVNDYQAETGLEPHTDASHYSVGQGGSSELSSRYLRDLASEAIILLGDRFADLTATDERGRLSPTPPPHRHRLIELVNDALVIADDLDHGAKVIDANIVSELGTCVSLFTRWHRHPAYAHLLKTLSDGSQVQHTVMLLAVASYFVDAGNGVGIIFRHSDQRIPDLWLTPSFTERLNIEVKTPTELRGPRKTTITYNDAVKLISRQLKKAASGGTGQLDQRHSGILAIGGFHLGSRSFEVLIQAATRVLASQSFRKKHLAAMLIMELTYDAPLITDQNTGHQRLTMQPVLHTEVIKHPGYRGSLQMVMNGELYTSIPK